MGNTVATAHEDISNFEFFKSLNISLIEEVFDALNGVEKTDDLDPKYILWTEYFGTLCGIKDKNNIKRELMARKQFHPATDGYTMKLDSNNNGSVSSDTQSTSSKKSNSVPDGYTDDSASSDEESADESSESSSSSGDAPRFVPKVYDSAIISPIFFGYSKEKITDKEEDTALRREEDQQKEFLAIERAKEHREQNIASTEQSTLNKQNSRQKKIDQLEKKYEENATRRRQEYEKQIAGLQGGQLKIIQDQFEKQEEISLTAFQFEMEEIVTEHKRKSKIENHDLQVLRDDLKTIETLEESLFSIINSASVQSSKSNKNKSSKSNKTGSVSSVRNYSAPNAARIEDFAKSEVKRCIGELNSKNEQMKKLTEELKLVQEELERLQKGNQSLPGMAKRVSETRSMVNIAETRLKSKIKEVTQASADLENVESLLKGAISRKNNEDDFLPLFSSIATGNDEDFQLPYELRKNKTVPNKCNKYWLFVAMVLLCSGNFSQKFDLIMKLFETSEDSEEESEEEDEEDDDEYEDDSKIDGQADNSKSNKSKQTGRSFSLISLRSSKTANSLKPVLTKGTKSSKSLKSVKSANTAKTSKTNKTGTTNGGGGTSQYAKNRMDSWLGWFTKDTILEFVSLVYEVFRLLWPNRMVLTTAELQNQVINGYLQFSINCEITSLSTQDFKEIVFILAVKGKIKEMFGSEEQIRIMRSWNTIHSDYHMYSMGAAALYSMSVVDINAVFYEQHLQAISYRPCLESSHKRMIHDWALSMGGLDKMRADYSKYLVKQKVVESYHIPPLDNVHMTSVYHKSEITELASLMKVQSFIRSYLERRRAVRLAKKQALEDAKEEALRQMKAVIMKEFQRREQGKGVGKMKWDAEVRLRQAKLRAMGSSASRQDTVMIIMEEAITGAKGIIDEKFAEIEKEQKLDVVKPVNKGRIQFKTTGDLERLFGLWFIPKTMAENLLRKSMLEDEKSFLRQATTASAPGEAGIGSLPGTAQGSRPATSASAGIAPETSRPNTTATNGRTRPTTSGSTTSTPTTRAVSAMGKVVSVEITRITEYLQMHNHLYFPTLKGETALFTFLRIFFQSPEVYHMLHLMYRLFFVHPKMTEFKAQEIVNEFPSKRLLLRYIDANSKDTLLEDLENYYHFKRNKQLEDVVDILKHLKISDLECGFLFAHMKHLQKHMDHILKATQDQYLQQLLQTAIQSAVSLKLQTQSAAKSVTEEELLHEEYELISKRIDYYEKQCNVILSRQEDDHRQLSQYQVSLMKFQHLYQALLQHAHFRDKYHVQIEKTILSMRRNWNLRFQQLQKTLFDKPTSASLKNTTSTAESTGAGDYSLPFIHGLCGLVEEFQSIAVTIASRIVDELYRPPYQQTVPVMHSRKVVGQRQVGTTVGKGSLGRGLGYPYGGHKIYYEYEEIVFYVGLDYDGIYNGSDECAMKILGKNRLGAEELFLANIPKLYSPLTMIIDYHGYRILAMAKLPLKHFVFSEEGQVLRTSEEQVHGFISEGKEFANKNKNAYHLLGVFGKKQNILEHACQGEQDITPNTSYAAYVKMNKGNDNLFYARNLWGIFPSEMIEQTPYLYPTSRNQQLYWRFLRPPLYTIPDPPVAVDSGRRAVFNFQDEKTKNFTRSLQLTDWLFTNVIPKFMDAWLARKIRIPYLDGLVGGFTNDMHRCGIPLRHLGYLRSLLWHKLPGKSSLFHHADVITCTADVREEILQHKGYILFPEQQNLLLSLKEIPLPTQTYECQLATEFDGLSILENDAYYGQLPVARVSDSMPLNTLILVEMMARTCKHLIRLQLRQYVQENLTCSKEYFKELVCIHFNFLTGFSEGKHHYYSEVIYTSIRERFGKSAVYPSERIYLDTMIQKVLPFLINRTTRLLGIQLSGNCKMMLNEQPMGFYFIPEYILDIHMIVKHNIPMYPFCLATKLVLEAQGLDAKRYPKVIVAAKPVAFYMLSERKGARIAINSGVLGNSYAGSINDGCALEQIGPIRYEKFIRAIGFRPETSGCVDTKHHPKIVPTNPKAPFTVEVLFRVAGGKDLHRTILASGRYKVAINREGDITLSFTENAYTLTFVVGHITSNHWMLVAFCFDGTSLRCRVNDELRLEIETEPLFEYKTQDMLCKHEESQANLRKTEQDEKTVLRMKVQKEAEEFFQSRQGASTLKQLTQTILDTYDFEKHVTEEEANGIGGEGKKLGEDEEVEEVDATATTFIKTRKIVDFKTRKTIALKLAKEQHIEETYATQEVDIVSHFANLQNDLQDSYSKQLDEGKLHAFDPLRIGASLPDANNRGGAHYFYGDISCVSIFDYCLSQDSLYFHYLSSIRFYGQDATRLYQLACQKFMHAYTTTDRSTSDFVSFMKYYLHALTSLLNIPPVERNMIELEQIRSELYSMIAYFRNLKILDPIAGLLMHIPRDQEYADLIVEATLAIKETNKKYFVQSAVNGAFERHVLITIPFDFGLLSMEHPARYHEAGAYLFQEVVRDAELMYSYGDLDLQWLPLVQNDLLVISIVKNAYEDKSLKIIRASELLSPVLIAKGVTNIMTDDDVQVLIENLPLLEGIDFMRCSSLTNIAMEYINRFSALKLLCLDHCSLITDQGFLKTKAVLPKLEVLSLQGLVHLTTASSELIAMHTRNLFTLNLNQCTQIMTSNFAELLRNNKQIHTLQLSGTITRDEELISMAAVMSSRHITMLDLSYCVYITDNGMRALGESNAILRILNLAGNTRITGAGIQIITNRCWQLEYLNLSDVFLTRDDAFAYNPVVDGRAAANEKMLSQLHTLLLPNCDRITDLSLRALGEKCRKITTLNLRNCVKITDTGFAYLSDPLLNAYATTACCITLTSISFAYLTNVSLPTIKQILKQTRNIESLDLSGLPQIVNDDFLPFLSTYCPSIQSLSIALCIMVTDQSLCTLSTGLWLEQLDITGCYRITNTGIEVLVESSRGLKSLIMHKLSRITKRCIYFAKKLCPQLLLQYDETIPDVAPGH